MKYSKQEAIDQVEQTRIMTAIYEAIPKDVEWHNVIAALIKLLQREYTAYVVELKNWLGD